MAKTSPAHAHAHDHHHHHDHVHDDHAHEDHPHDHPTDRHADDHEHHVADARAASKLPWVLLFTLIFFVVELVAAHVAESNALRADAIHLLADVLAIAIAWIAFRLSDRRPNARFTFGLRRIEAIAALMNAVLVLLGAAEIVHEGVDSLQEHLHPRTAIMLGVAAAALVVHGINATLLHHDLHGHAHAHPKDHDDARGMSPHVHVGGHLSVRGAWMHVAADALGAFVALAAAAAIRFGAPASVDPIASFFVALLLVIGGIKLLRDAGYVLMESAPAHLPVEEIERVVKGVDGVECVHRLRVWTLGTGYDAIALHVTARDDAGLGLAAAVERRLKESFHVDYVCVQVDPPGSHEMPEKQG